jgi:hypothetical protein
MLRLHHAVFFWIGIVGSIVVVIVVHRVIKIDRTKNVVVRSVFTIDHTKN